MRSQKAATRLLRTFSCIESRCISFTQNDASESAATPYTELQDDEDDDDEDKLDISTVHVQKLINEALLGVSCLHAIAMNICPVSCRNPGPRICEESVGVDGLPVGTAPM